MIPEEIKKWTSVLKDLTSTTVIILLFIGLVYENTGERKQAAFAAKASAEESVRVGRQLMDKFEEHTKMTSEESSVVRMILIQICINTAYGDKQAIQQCANYR